MGHMTSLPISPSSNCRWPSCLQHPLISHRYQFNPQLNNPNVIVNILIKSLASTVNGPDFNLCLSLLREPTVSWLPFNVESELI